MTSAIENKIQAWKEEEAAPFAGWDFSHIAGRWQDGELPWDYKTVVQSFLKPEMKLLDMGTGGGEFLLTLAHPFGNTSVTEGWQPNYELCLRHLAPLGITVKFVRDDILDFPDGSFDIILNRHESYLVDELKRVLRPGGIVITQQVGGTNNTNLSRRLIPGFTPEFPDHDLTRNLSLFTNAGFEILRSDEICMPLRFFDTGALVYFAANAPWEFPGFSVDTHLPQLLEIDDEISRNGFVSGTEHRFLIVARKP